MRDAFRIRHLETTESTNSDIASAAEAGEKAGLVIWADIQTKGRGRQGRTWQSPAGNLYFSLLLRPPCLLRHAFHYGFVAGIALQRTLAPLLPSKKVTIKWPNDILVDKKKVSGILLETSSQSDQTLEWVAIGMGLNLASHPSDLAYATTSLKDEGRSDLLPGAVLDCLCDQFRFWQDKLEKEGFTAIRQEWLHYAQKGPLSVHLREDHVTGAFFDLDEEGSLVLDLANGQKRAIAAGDVFVG